MDLRGALRKLTELIFHTNSQTVTIEPEGLGTRANSTVFKIPDVSGDQIAVTETHVQTLAGKTLDTDTTILEGPTNRIAGFSHSQDSSTTISVTLPPTTTDLIGHNTPHTLTYKTLDANDVSNSLTNITDANIKSSGADITRDKLLAGTADEVLINDGSGVMSSEAQLDRTRGGTGISSTATFPASGVVVTRESVDVLKNKTLDTTLTTLQDGDKDITISHSQPSPSTIVVTMPSETTNLVGHNTTDILTNKDFDVDAAGNSLTNIADANIKTGADIARDKLLAGAINQVLVNDGAGVMASEAQLDKTRGGTGISSTATFPASGTVVTQDSTDTLTNKTIDADGIGNTISNIEDANIKAGAAIDRTKLSSGTVDAVLVNDGSGVMTSEAQLDKTRGGTGISSTATFPASGVIITEDSSNALTNKTFNADGVGNSITNIEDADIKADAGIVFSKMETLTGARGLVTDPFGAIIASNITEQEMSYLAGVESNIQDQIDNAPTTLQDSYDNDPVNGITTSGGNDLIVSGTEGLSITAAGGLDVTTLKIKGLTSGYVGIAVPATPTSYDLTLPNAIGAAGSVLTDAAGDGILGWSPAGASGWQTVTTTGPNYIPATDEEAFIDTTGTVVSVYPPSATKGTRFRLIDDASTWGTNFVYVYGDSGDTFDGVTGPLVLNVDDGIVELVGDTGNWRVLVLK